jgi:hypothetical protein
VRQRIQPTGTNRPRAWGLFRARARFGTLRGCGDAATGVVPTRLKEQRRPAERTVSGGHGGGDTPVPIPNTAVKPARADGTWGEAPWESRSPPGFRTTMSPQSPGSRGFRRFAARARFGRTGCVHSFHARGFLPAESSRPVGAARFPVGTHAPAEELGRRSGRDAPTQARIDTEGGRPQGWTPPQRVGRQGTRPVTQREPPEPHRPHHPERSDRPVGATRPAPTGNVGTRGNRKRPWGRPDATRRLRATPTSGPCRGDAAAEPHTTVGQRGTPRRTRGGAPARL